MSSFEACNYWLALLFQIDCIKNQITGTRNPDNFDHIKQLTTVILKKIGNFYLVII